MSSWSGSRRPWISRRRSRRCTGLSEYRGARSEHYIVLNRAERGFCYKLTCVLPSCSVARQQATAQPEEAVKAPQPRLRQRAPPQPSRKRGKDLRNAGWFHSVTHRCRQRELTRGPAGNVRGGSAKKQNHISSKHVRLLTNQGFLILKSVRALTNSQFDDPTRHG